MRVTQSMLSNTMLRNLSKSYQDMDKYMNQLSTGKKITKPSDDPVVAVKGMEYRSQVTDIQQYQRNVGEVHNWLDNSDSALDKATKALHRMRELAVQASNDTYEVNQRTNIATEVEQLKEHIVDIANTQVNDKYIFNGTNTDTKPVTMGEDGYEVATTVYPVMIQVANNTTFKASTEPGEMFSKELFEQIDQFTEALRNNDQAGIEQSIENIDVRTDKLINERADLGARMNRLDLIENRLLDQEITATKIMSENENADIEEVIMNLTAQESVHRAALSVGARVIQPSLLDFLR